MRLALKERQPALMHEYGLKPWEIGLLTADEIHEIIRHQDERYKAMRDAAAAQRRR